jgi:hypothetical protein
MEEAADKYETLEFETGSPWDLATGALEGAGALFGETRGLMTEVVELLNQGQTTRAMDLLANCLQVWHQASESVRRTSQLIGLDLDGVTVAGEPVAGLFSKLGEQLNGVKEALEGRDYVLLSDIVQYELPATTEQWQQMIQVILSRIETNRQAV